MTNYILSTQLKRIPKLKSIYVGLFICIGLNLIKIPDVNAQNLPINDLMEEQMRIQQLFHGITYTSMTIRPVWRGHYDKYMELADPGYGLWSENYFQPVLKENNLSLALGVYAPTTRMTINSQLPYGDNNESAWYGRGLNSELMAGLWVTSKYFTLSFRPQITHQQNLNFEHPRFITYNQEDEILFQAEGIGDIIDMPFRFGNEPYSTFDLGYSSFRLHVNQFQIGIGTEPMSWGSMIKYPLLMSNNAPGLRHFFGGTRSPIRIPYVGHLEFSIIGAFPKDSKYFTLKEDEEVRDRFMSGINFSFTPKFAPNLNLGFARNIHTYLDEGGFTMGDLGHLLDPFYLKEFIDTRGVLNDIKPRNHLNSIYARWLWPENHFEIYGEYYREDFAWDSRDLLMEPRHNSGYAFGAQKLIFAPGALFYRMNVEFTNMTPSYLQEVRPQNYYYTHPEIRQGHTNEGQVLGAGIGPGSNSQFIQIDAYKDWGRYGLFFRRLADNNHFHYQFDRSLNRPEEFRRGYGDYWRNRTDLTIGLTGLYQINRLIISGSMSWTKLFNYGRFDYGRFGGLNISNFEPYDTTNVQVQISFSYRI